MQFFANHALLVVLATPLIAALVLALLPQNMITAAHALASAFGLLGFLVALPLLARFTPGSSTYVFKESVEWIPSLDAHFCPRRGRHKPSLRCPHRLHRHALRLRLAK